MITSASKQWNRHSSTKHLALDPGIDPGVDPGVDPGWSLRCGADRISAAGGCDDVLEASVDLGSLRLIESFFALNSHRCRCEQVARLGGTVGVGRRIGLATTA